MSNQGVELPTERTHRKVVLSSTETGARAIGPDEPVMLPEVQQRPAVPRSLTDSTENIANLLAAAKPVIWRGRGELPQRPWKQLRFGLWLVIDLWGGLSTLPMMLLALGIRIIVFSAEGADLPSKCTARAFPNIVRVSSVEEVCAPMFAKLATRERL